MIRRKSAPFRAVNHEYDFSFIDLFAGIGGIRKGFEQAGGKCVFTSEWDTYAQKTYTANFPSNEPVNGDITKISEKDLSCKLTLRECSRLMEYPDNFIGLVQESAGSLTSLAEFTAHGGKFRYFYGKVAQKLRSLNNPIIPISDTRAYKQFGNSVIVPLFHTIAEFIKPLIL
jgi:site-specific DNA-cytosine methylase